MANNRERLFITGATGFIGSNLLRSLDSKKYEITLLVRQPTDTLSQQYNIVQGDLRDPSSYQQALAGQDTLLHLAALYQIGVVNRKRMFSINVTGACRLVDLAWQNGISKIVYVSSTAALGETSGEQRDESSLHNGLFRSYYEETKHIAHMLMQQRLRHGCPLVIATPGGVFGEGDKGPLFQAINDYFRGKIPFQIDSRSRFNLTHVRNVCSALRLLLEKADIGGSWLMTGASVSMQEVFELLASYSRKPVPKMMKREKIKWLAALLDGISKLTGIKFPLNRETLKILDGSDYSYDSEKLRKIFAWCPGEFTEEFNAYLASNDFDFRREN